MPRFSQFSRLVIVGLVVAAIGRAAATPPDDKIDREKLRGITEQMQDFVDDQHIAGAVTVVGRKSGIISIDAVGYLNLERGQPMPKNALFRIASMTKPITAIAIMMLVDDGKIAVDDPVEKHLHEFRGQMLIASRDGETITLKKPTRPITIRDLLTHTSGLAGRLPDGLGDLYQRRNRTLAEAVMAFSQRPLEFEPGSKWAYCNPGIDTLGRIVEVVSEQSFEEFLDKRLFQPLGMHDTTLYPRDEKAQRLAGLYDRKDDKLVKPSSAIIGVPPDARYPIPAGGLCSTGPDLARLYQMMLGRGRIGDTRVLSESSVDTMTKLQTGELTTGFTPGMGFGFGWAVVREPQGVTAMLSPGTYGHGGAFGTQAWIDPSKDLFLVLLIQRVGLPNADGSDMRRLFQEIAVSAVK